MESLEVNFEVAKVAGVNAALVLSLISRRTETVTPDGIFYDQDRVWMRASMEAISERIPFLSVAAVRTAIRKLKEAGLITVENLNATPYDHTKWYTLTEKAEELINPAACRPGNVIH